MSAAIFNEFTGTCHGGYPGLVRVTGVPQSRPRDRDDFERMRAWAEGAVETGYPNVHAAAIDWCFAPPESYDDGWLEKLHEVLGFVESIPCTCPCGAEAAVDTYEPCGRCKVLNRANDEYMGHGR